jgi:squalene-hopene/tetraprenyl-beta-curcumene cyclase
VGRRCRKGRPGRGERLQGAGVGTAPGYYPAAAGADTEGRVQLLRGYLRAGLPGQNLYNRAWALWASTQLKGVLTKDEQQAIIGQLFARQREGGTAQETASDGYATGLVLHVLQTAGVPKGHRQLSRGLAWLKANQAASGAWASTSLNKKRDPATHVGKFMSDAATAFAVLALAHP